MSDYAFVHNGKAFTPNQTPVDATAVDVHNAGIEALELAMWQTKPLHMLAYYDTKTATVTTWRGIVIGQIVTSRVYDHNFGSRMISLTVRGTNGAIYHGRASFDHGSCVHLRLGKS